LAAEVFVGTERFAARKMVIQQLKADGLLQKEEEHPTRLGFSQRTNAVVEPRISTQWFVKMSAMAGPALTAVTEGYIDIHPGDKFLATYKYWLENVKDWCISRQLWWGQQIPAWYAPDGSFRVAATREEAFAKFGAAAAGSPMTTGSTAAPGTPPLPFSADDLRQDEDVLDTWFSSWLWPIEVFKGITNPGNPDINYYYPTSVLVTGQDIIFFWVARMIMAGLYYFPDTLPMEKRIPFRDVYFTGMVRDKQGRKMSKSLGNSPDLLELIDKYGADAVRFGIMISSPAGNDLLFDEAALEQGRNFNNKLWNALKLVRTVWKVAAPENSTPGFFNAGELPDVNKWIPQPDNAAFATEWFRNKLRNTIEEITKLYDSFRLSEALKTIYTLIWDDFCSWYLEWIKPEFGGEIDCQTYSDTVCFFEELMQLLHPFMPFVTEEIYHLLAERQEGDDLCIKQFEKFASADKNKVAEGEYLKRIIADIRTLKTKAGLGSSEFDVHFSAKQYERLFPLILKNTKAANIIIDPRPIEDALTIVIGKDIILIKPLKHVANNYQKEELLKDLEYLKGFLNTINKKLQNKKFVENARPEVIALEKKKREDTEEKIKVLELSLSSIK
ncbi:MAG TPA: class I tRNA ligase family protein, partial [Puia sp.]|nr:class I tRNA ligase family protein [Puia sp.]